MIEAFLLFIGAVLLGVISAIFTKPSSLKTIFISREKSQRRGSWRFGQHNVGFTLDNLYSLIHREARKKVY